MADLVDSQIAEIGIVRMWSCYKNGYIKQLRSRKLQYYTVADLNVAVTVGPKSPLFHRESDYITAEELRDQPAVMYSNMDSGPYADIYRRLQIPKGASRFVISTRSAIYEVLSNTGCYYLNSAYPFEVLDVGRPSNYSEYRTLYLENCGISSEIAWIKREDYVMSQLANEVVNSVAYYFA